MKDDRRHVIVEGYDGTGKTLYSKTLAYRLGWRYRHVGNAPTSREEYEGNLDRFRGATGSSIPVVFDRCPVISEYIYGDGSIVGGVDDVVRELQRARIKLIILATVDDAGDLCIEATEARGDVERTADILREGLHDYYLHRYRWLFSVLSNNFKVLEYQWRREYLNFADHIILGS